MYDFHRFEDVFEHDLETTYSDKQIKSIESNRRLLQGTLFIDRVLKLLDIKRAAKHYPPKSTSILRTLHQEITTSPFPRTTQLSALFYLLLDIAPPAAHTFASATSLPSSHQTLILGLWNLDNLNIQTALLHLTHPSLLPTFQDEILIALVHTAKADYTPALAYYHTVSPTLTTPEALQALSLALANTSIPEAYHFSRSHNDNERRLLFETLVEHVINGPSTKKTAERAMELVGLPFDDEEEGWFEEYLAAGEGSGLKRAGDTLMMRKIVTGRYVEALDCEVGPDEGVHGMSWDSVRDGLEKGLGPQLELV